MFLVQLLRNQPSIDSMEAIMWGELLSFGTNKHPPLSGWIMGGFYNLLGQHEQIAYLLGPICISIGLVFIYKLAKNFISEEKAICSAMLMPVCFYYTYILFIDNFNCNFLSMAFFPAIAYFYYKSIKENKIRDWLFLGITTGLETINKYQVLFLLIPLFIHFIIFERKQFKQKGLYIALLSGILVILPHVIWLVQNDFFSFMYMSSQSGGGSEAEVIPLFSPDRILRPLKFIADQILAVASCVAAYLILAFQAKNISFNTEKITVSDKVFILLIACGIVLSQAGMGILNGCYIHGIWGSIMVGFVGLALFSFFPIKFNEKSFAFFIKLSYILLILWTVAVLVFALLQVKHNISYPHQKNIPAFHEFWAEKTNNAPLKYVGGHIDYIFQFRVYDKEQPKVILDTFGYKSPWLDYEDIKNSGALIFSKKDEDLDETVRGLLLYLPEDYKITHEHYDYEIVNKFGRAKKYTVYYAVIPPKKND